MVNKEREAHPNLENGNLIIVNASELMRDNPAALIVNKESYGRMLGNFTTGLEGQFEPPQVVRVKTYSSEHGEVEKFFVLDGLTRTKFVNDHLQDVILPKYPDFALKVKDVTESVLQNPEVIPLKEKTEDQKVLTMLQYLRAIIPPTIEHSQIAPDRIAAHLINGWKNMVGKELAKKYSALAALSFLSNQSINIATDDALRKDLTRQSKIMSGETIEERVRLQAELIKMASIIIQTRLVRQEVARSAFMLVSAESPVIGGEKEARKQIYGLLHTPEVESKLTEAFSNIGEREQMRDQLGNFISESFKKVQKVPNREEVINVLGFALKHQHLNFNYVIDVFTSENPIQRYDQVREEVNKDRLSKTYISVQKVTSLSSVENQLIDRLGGKTELTEAEIYSLARAVKSADVALQRAEGLKIQLATNHEQLLSSGVTTQLLDEAMSSINLTHEEVTSSGSLSIITSKTQKLTDTINEINRRITSQISSYKIGRITDQISGEKLKEGYGPQIRSDIVNLVMGEFRILTDQNSNQVRQRVRELASLDSDLILRVKTGDLSRIAALQRQRERQTKVKPVETALIVETPITSSTKPTESGVGVRIPTPPEPTVPPTEEAIFDSQKLEERRKRVNREKLNVLLDELDKKLVNVDLEYNDITDVELQRINRTVRKLGRLGYNHPDTPRVMMEDYPRLQREIGKLREELIRRDINNSEKDTRTKK